MQEVRTAGGLWYPLLFAKDVKPPPPAPLRLRVMRLKPVRPFVRFVAHRILKRTGGTWIFDPAFVQDLLDTGDRLADAARSCRRTRSRCTGSGRPQAEAHGPALKARALELETLGVWRLRSGPMIQVSPEARSAEIAGAVY